MTPYKPIDYNPLDEASILAHAIKLLGKSLHDLYPEANKKEGKGNIGNSVEFYHFGYLPNNDSKPDFEEVNREVKVTPLDKTRGGYTAGERLVIGMMDFVKEAQATDITRSHFWEKSRLLLMFYLRKKSQSYLDFIFHMIRYWEIPETDLKIIIDDWNKIHQKLLDGKAHEMHEGDTMYLSTCKKGDKTTKPRKQFVENAPMVYPRAYCLKQTYMYWVVADSFLGNTAKTTEMYLSPEYITKLKNKRKKLGNIVSENTQYQENQTFQDYVISCFTPYINKTIEEIAIETNTTINFKAKDYGYKIAKAILGVKADCIAEFEKANVLLKTIRLDYGCQSIEQHMSFPAIKWIDLANVASWKNSTWYKTISKAFFFVVFERPENDKRDETIESEDLSCRKKLILKGVFFWSINNAVERNCRLIWKDTREKVLANDYEHFSKVSENKYCHVRPHDSKALYNAPTIQGKLQKKKCFWFKNTFVYSIVKKNLHL